MAKNDKVQIWVTKDFKKKLKREAAELEIPILDYTRKLAKRETINTGEKIRPKKITNRGFIDDFNF